MIVLLTDIPNPMYKSQRIGKTLDSSRLPLTFHVRAPKRVPHLLDTFEECARRLGEASQPMSMVHADCIFFNGEFPRVFSSSGRFTDLAAMVRLPKPARVPRAAAPVIGASGWRGQSRAYVLTGLSCGVVGG